MRKHKGRGTEDNNQGFIQRGGGVPWDSPPPPLVQNLFWGGIPLDPLKKVCFMYNYKVKTIHSAHTRKKFVYMQVFMFVGVLVNEVLLFNRKKKMENMESL